MPTHWMEMVSEVFDTNPRNGNSSQTVWLSRRKLEKLLDDELFTRGRHICVDGCSGCGKSSLVITSLLRHKIPYTTVQVTRTMTWSTFCRQLIAKPKRTERSARIGADAEWKGLFPSGKLRFELGMGRDENVTHEYWERIVSSASEHDIAQAVAAQDCVVLVDEFERAKPELASSVSEVCKILTQTHVSKFAKLVILGADDVYKKLYDAYSTLDNRLVQISIPTLPGPGESWKYLKLGFAKLGKFHPGNSKYAGKGDEEAAVRAMYCAADGLFKSLTELGVEICRCVGPKTRGITLSHMKQVCDATERKNYSKYRSRFAAIHRLASRNPVAVAVLIHMNQNGLGQMHNREEIEDALVQYGKGLVDDAILALWKDDFLVMTGDSNQRLFIKNPSWAHTLRVYLSDPGKKKKLERHLDKPMQFSLDLDIDWAHLEGDEGDEGDDS